MEGRGVEGDGMEGAVFPAWWSNILFLFYSCLHVVFRLNK